MSSNSQEPPVRLDLKGIEKTLSNLVEVSNGMCDFGLEESKTQDRQSLTKSVSVLCRIRPENREEKQIGTRVVNFESNNDRTVHVETHRCESMFQFDRCYRPHNTQREVFADVGVPTVESVIEGYNSAVIAYGQTGSGKTYTMYGPGYDGVRTERKLNTSEVKPGLVPRTLRLLFDRVRAMERDSEDRLKYTITISNIEVYQEVIRDLLRPGPLPAIRKAGGGGLKIRQHPYLGWLHVPAATNIQVDNVTECLEVLRSGIAKRTQASTNANANSSRSHSIVIVQLKRVDHEMQLNRFSHLYLCDLAGSEKVGKTGARGVRLDEARYINTSLSALGRVIYALSLSAQNKSLDSFVPYRESKLTRLLQNCIGGNARCSLLVCASPSSLHADETVSTMRFGERAQYIENKLEVNTALTHKQLQYIINQQCSVIRELYSGALRGPMVRAPSASERLRSPVSMSVSDTPELYTRPMSAVTHLNPMPTRRHSTEFSGNKFADPNDRLLSGVSADSGAGFNRRCPFHHGFVASKVYHRCCNRGGRGLQPMHHEEVRNVLVLNESRVHDGVRGQPGIRELLYHFLCPLTKRVMTDPVVAMDGHTYEREAIREHFRRCLTSPVTGEEMREKILIPNSVLKSQIAAYYTSHAFIPQSVRSELTQYPKAARRGMTKVESSLARQDIGKRGRENIFDFSPVRLCVIDAMPLHLLTYMCSFFDPVTLGRLGQCSRTLHYVTNKPELWQRHCEVTFLDEDEEYTQALEKLNMQSSLVDSSREYVAPTKEEKQEQESLSTLKSLVAERRTQVKNGMAKLINGYSKAYRSYKRKSKSITSDTVVDGAEQLRVKNDHLNEKMGAVSNLVELSTDALSSCCPSDREIASTNTRVVTKIANPFLGDSKYKALFLMRFMEEKLDTEEEDIKKQELFEDITIAKLGTVVIRKIEYDVHNNPIDAESTHDAEHIKELEWIQKTQAKIRDVSPGDAEVPEDSEDEKQPLDEIPEGKGQSSEQPQPAKKKKSPTKSKAKKSKRNSHRRVSSARRVSPSTRRQRQRRPRASRS